MRMITGWTKEEIEELKKGIYSHYDSMAMIYSIVRGNSNPKLYAKYMDCEPQQLTQMARDIIDFYDDTARFPEKKFRVVLPDENTLIYDKDRGYRWTFYALCDSFHYQTMDPAMDPDETTHLTKQQIVDYNPDLMPFAVEVSDD